MPWMNPSRDGHLNRAPNGGFIYVPIHGGYLFYVDPAFGVQRIVRRQDRRRFPFRHAGPEEPGDDDDPSSETRVHGSGVDGAANRLYVTLTEVTNDNMWIATYIDVYEWATGQYTESYSLPFYSDSAHLFGDEIIALRQGSLVRIRWDEYRETQGQITRSGPGLPSGVDSLYQPQTIQET